VVEANNRQTVSMTQATATITPTDTSTLVDDGDILDITDSRRLVLHVKHDEESSINDYEGDGRTHPCGRLGRANRPDDFSGRARKLQVSRSEWVWWEPYDGPIGWTDANDVWQATKWDNLPEAQRQIQVGRVTDLIAFGFQLVGVELQERVTDSRGGSHWISVDTEWVGAVDEIYPELVSDLAEEVMSL